jgi:hypothetical protein
VSPSTRPSALSTRFFRRVAHTVAAPGERGWRIRPGGSCRDVCAPNQRSADTPKNGTSAPPGNVSTSRRAMARSRHCTGSTSAAVSTSRRGRTSTRTSRTTRRISSTCWVTTSPAAAAAAFLAALTGRPTRRALDRAPAVGTGMAATMAAIAVAAEIPGWAPYQIQSSMRGLFPASSARPWRSQNAQWGLTARCVPDSPF